MPPRPIGLCWAAPHLGDAGLAQKGRDALAKVAPKHESDYFTAAKWLSKLAINQKAVPQTPRAHPDPLPTLQDPAWSAALAPVYKALAVLENPFPPAGIPAAIEKAKSPTVMTLAGRVALKQNDPETASQYFTQASGARRSGQLRHPIARLKVLATADKTVDTLDANTAALNKLLGEGPVSAGTRAAVGLAVASNYAHQGRRPRPSAPEKALKSRDVPPLGQLRLRLALAEQMLLSDAPATAEKLLKAAGPAAFGEPDGHLLWGALFTEFGDIPQAEKKLTLAYKRNPVDPRVPFWRARSFEKQGRAAKKIETEYRTALELQPNHLPAALGLAKHLRNQGQTEAGVAVLRAAEAAGAAPISIQLARATALTDSKKFTEAVTILQRVLATPEALEQRQGEVMVSLAEAYQAQGDLLRAANTLEEAEALEAPPPRLVARQAALAQAQGSFGAALTLWGKAVKDEDAIGEDFVNLGRVAYKLRRPQSRPASHAKARRNQPAHARPSLLYRAAATAKRGARPGNDHV